MNNPLRTHAYLHGHRAGQRGKPPCAPYEGHTDASMSLQQEWLRGWFDGTTGVVVRQARKRGPSHRRTVRKRWPRSEYARMRVREYLGVQG